MKKIAGRGGLGISLEGTGNTRLSLVNTLNTRLSLVNTYNTHLSLVTTLTVDVEDGQEVRPHHYIRSILPQGPVGCTNTFWNGDQLLEVIMGS